jgi:hypothetical protein
VIALVVGGAFAHDADAVAEAGDDASVDAFEDG